MSTRDVAYRVRPSGMSGEYSTDVCNVGCHAALQTPMLTCIPGAEV
jgi:hypothetical protein